MVKEIFDNDHRPAEFSPAKRLELSRSDVVFETIPEQHVEAIVRSINDYLETYGIDKNDVLFSGFSDKPAKVKQQFEREQLLTLTKEVNQLYASGYFDIHPDEKAIYAERLNRLKKLSTKNAPDYFFGDYDSLLTINDSELSTEHNPIDYAGTRHSPSIAIYDKAKLMGLKDFVEVDGVYSVTANAEEVEQAKLAIVKPHYVEGQ